MVKYIEIYKSLNMYHDKNITKKNIKIEYLGHDNWRLYCDDEKTFDYLKNNYKYYKLRIK